MTEPMTNVDTMAEACTTSVQHHSTLKDWLLGKAPDKAIAAMMLSAASKKPGKVLKRLSKHLDTIFEPARVVKWEKGEKFVYAAAYTQGDEDDVQTQGLGATAMFHTDLYLRTREEHTEINAVTVSAITTNAIAGICKLRSIEDAPATRTLARQAMTAARVFSTGLEAAGITHDNPCEFLVPFGKDVLVARNMPILRTESGVQKMGQIVSIRSIKAEADLAPRDIERLSTLPEAMTKTGHPGADAFGALVKNNAVSVS